MRILVLSDTHIPVAASCLPEIIEEEAKKSDICLHAGDFVSIEVFNKISKWLKIYGVSGNMDDFSVKETLEEKKVINIEDVTLGLIHGRGAPSNLIYYINKEFSSQRDKIDIFVFGHSHFPLNEEINKKIYFNPGSPTDKIFAPYRSYGILEINGRKIMRRIIKID